MVDNTATVVMRRTHSRTPRQRVYAALDTARSGDRLSKFVDVCLVSLISFSIVAVILESIPYLEERYLDIFYWVEVVTVSVFTVEYLLRVWVAPEDEDRAKQSSGDLFVRLRFMVSTYAL
ncbi:hypothetical protein MJD09_15345, partial [bacterium]|nr:hypothetical protein [bacterium]